VAPQEGEGLSANRNEIKGEPISKRGFLPFRLNPNDEVSFDLGGICLSLASRLTESLQ
jgi:hypothetical protein